MKNLWNCILWGILTTTGFADAPGDKNFKDLHKKTAHGFIVPYTLRYNPEEWSCKYVDGGHELRSLKNTGLVLTISANKEEKKFSQEFLDKSLQSALGTAYSDSSLYQDFEIKPSKLMIINGINFLHQSAIVHLTPHSVHFESLGKVGLWQKRCIPEQGSQIQRDYYTYSGDGGLILCIFRSENPFSKEDQETIDELFRGFSF